MRPLDLARRAVFAAAFVALVVTPVARATPPPNDNRAAAQVIDAFPAAIHGTLAEATIERLDPQVSECGPIASTVWYRIDVAPDGTLSFALRGAAGVAPVVRIYSRGTSALQEVTCASADAGGLAATSFDTTRGGNYFVLVGRKPTSADGEFDLHVDLKLPPEPPSNDKFAAAQRLAHLPVTVKGTTVGARSEASDPEGCDLGGATVWYKVRPAHDGLILLKLHANGKLDAVVGWLARARSRLGEGTCRQTNAHGDATVSLRGLHSSTYFIVVGQQRGSRAGTFALTALAAAPPEALPGRALPGHAVRATLNGLTNVNDVWHTNLNAGTTYRFAFSSPKVCARAELLRRTDRAVLASVRCSGYRTFTPGPDGGGMYIVRVLAAASDTAQPYKLQLAAAQADDIGIGLPLAIRTTKAARLDPQGVDVVDLYHFDVTRRSDVKLVLASAPATSYKLVLVTEGGNTLARDGGSVRRTLDPGRYVIAVTADAGTPGGVYRLTLLVRDLTTTTITLPTTTVSLGSAVTLRPVVTPTAGGVVELQIDRFDPLGGWQFTKLVRLSAGGSLTWVPPAAGTWRVRATYLGTITTSPSRSEYALLTVR